jgi:hypothetical protein
LGEENIHVVANATRSEGVIVTSPYNSGNTSANAPKQWLDEESATVVAFVLGFIAVCCAIGAVFTTIEVIKHSIVAFIAFYVAAICWEYNTTGVAKDGLTKGEALGVLFVPLHFVVKALKLRNAGDRLGNTQTNQSNPDRNLLSEDAATKLGYALWVVFVLAAAFGVSKSLDILGTVIGLVFLVYFTGLGAAYVLLDVRKDGLDSSEVAVVALWPRLYGKTIDEMKATVNTTSVPHQRPATS